MPKQILPLSKQVMSCVVCTGETISTVERERVPTLQNRVYSSPRDALAAKCGRLEVQACRRCGHAFNAAFDSALLAYDEHYNNDVPSPTFADYYRKIASQLRQQYLPNGGLVLDIRCGKGQFLQTLTEMFADVQGVGIDPSCCPRESKRLKLIAAEFPKSLPEQTPDLVVCRHTLEHIPDPVNFVRSIAAAVPSRTPIFFEVPDTAWIVQNRAFWDWCYEHVNYFVASSAQQMLMAANIEKAACRTAFGGQYLWIEGVIGKSDHIRSSGNTQFASTLLDYAQQEAEYTASARRQILEWKSTGATIAVWGMATKGIEFVAMVDPLADIVDYCVDINPLKQDKYTPLSARVIRSPVVLQQIRSPLLVIVMNPCYLNEIREECRRMSLDTECITMGFENKIKSAAA